MTEQYAKWYKEKQEQLKEFEPTLQTYLRLKLLKERYIHSFYGKVKVKGLFSFAEEMEKILDIQYKEFLEKFMIKDYEKEKEIVPGIKIESPGPEEEVIEEEVKEIVEEILEEKLEKEEDLGEEDITSIKKELEELRELVGKKDT